MAEPDATLCDPLRLDLQRQTQKLIDQFPGDGPIAALRNVSSRQALLDHLSMLLLSPQYTMAVCMLFKPLLLDLCARWLHQDTDMLEKFEALCLLIEICEELYSCVSPLSLGS